MNIIIFGIMYFFSKQLGQRIKAKFTPVAIIDILIIIGVSILHPTLCASIVNSDWQAKALLVLSFFGDIIAIGVLTLMHAEIKSKDLKTIEVKGILLSLFAGVILASITLSTSGILINIASCVAILLTSAILLKHVEANESNEELKIIGFLGCLYFSMRPVEYIALLNIMTVEDLTAFTILWFVIIGITLKVETISFEMFNFKDLIKAIPIAIMGIGVTYTLILNEGSIFSYTLCYCYILIFDMKFRSNLNELNTKAKENIFNSFKESGIEIGTAIKQSIEYLKLKR